MPLRTGWMPAVWRTDLLVPFRPCRGALLWEVSIGNAGEQRANPLARVDELWLRFADPRTPGAHVWAVSVMDEAGEYAWLTRAEVETLRVRRDDPTVVRCDSRVRGDVAAPATWDQVGLDE